MGGHMRESSVSESRAHGAERSPCWLVTHGQLAMALAACGVNVALGRLRPPGAGAQRATVLSPLILRAMQLHRAHVKEALPSLRRGAQLNRECRNTIILLLQNGGSREEGLDRRAQHRVHTL